MMASAPIRRIGAGCRDMSLADPLIRAVMAADRVDPTRGAPPLGCHPRRGAPHVGQTARRHARNF
jgi:hypothetical protein